MKVADIVWGIVFIGIGIVGGVVIGGVVGHNLGVLIAGACFAVIGVVLLIGRATFRPKLTPGPKGHVFATFTQLPVWAWVVVVVLLVVGIACLIFLREARI